MPPAGSTPGLISIDDVSIEVEASSAGRERPVRWVGKYRILSELGRGGMANVYLALAQGAGGVSKLVVLKALLPELASEPAALTMFLDEARLAAQLNHANVVQTYEVGTEGERQVIVMEYLEGQSFAHLIKRAGLAGHELSQAMHLRIIISVLEGLHYAHELCGYDGTPLLLVHRDVSPQNIFVTYGGQVKVLDFGIAKATSSSTHTATGIVKGKISYMAPEQMVADNVDRRADIYSVGCLLWAIATGKKLWKDMPDVHIMRRVISAEIPSPQSVSPACDDDLNAIVMKALACDPGQRYQTAAELQEALENYCERFTLHVKQKELGLCVSNLFADTRAELKALVERQLSLAINEEPTSIANTGDFSRSDVRKYASHTRSNPNLEFGVESGSGSGPAPSRRRWLPWLGLTIVLALGAGFLAMRSSSQVAAGTNAPAATPARTPAPSTPAASVATIQFRASPAQAKLFIDDQLLPSNPTSKVLPIDGVVHRLRAEAPGYSSGVEEFSVTGDAALAVDLVKAAAPDQPSARGVRHTYRVTKPARAVPPASAAPVVVAPRPACARPFFVDTDGIKKLRPECI